MRGSAVYASAIEHATIMLEIASIITSCLRYPGRGTARPGAKTARVPPHPPQVYTPATAPDNSTTTRVASPADTCSWSGTHAAVHQKEVNARIRKQRAQRPRVDTAMPLPAIAPNQANSKHHCTRHNAATIESQRVKSQSCNGSPCGKRALRNDTCSRTKSAHSPAVTRPTDAHLPRRRTPPRDGSQARRYRGRRRDDGQMRWAEEMEIGGHRAAGPPYETFPSASSSAKASASSSAATPASICSLAMIKGGAITKWLSHELIATPLFIMAAAT